MSSNILPNIGIEASKRLTIEQTLNYFNCFSILKNAFIASNINIVEFYDRNGSMVECSLNVTKQGRTWILSKGEADIKEEAKSNAAKAALIVFLANTRPVRKSGNESSSARGIYKERITATTHLPDYLYEIKHNIMEVMNSIVDDGKLIKDLTSPSSIKKNVNTERSNNASMVAQEGIDPATATEQKVLNSWLAVEQIGSNSSSSVDRENTGSLSEERNASPLDKFLTPSIIETVLETWNFLCFMQLHNAFKTFSININEFYKRKLDNSECTLSVTKDGKTWYLGKGEGETKEKARCNAAKSSVKMFLKKQSPAEKVGQTKIQRKSRELPDYLMNIRLKLLALANRIIQKELQRNGTSFDFSKKEKRCVGKNSEKEKINEIKTSLECEKEISNTNYEENLRKRSDDKDGGLGLSIANARVSSFERYENSNALKIDAIDACPAQTISKKINRRQADLKNTSVLQFDAVRAGPRQTYLTNLISQSQKDPVKSIPHTNPKEIRQPQADARETSYSKAAGESLHSCVRKTNRSRVEYTCVWKTNLSRVESKKPSQETYRQRTERNSSDTSMSRQEEGSSTAIGQNITIFTSTTEQKIRNSSSELKQERSNSSSSVNLKDMDFISKGQNSSVDKSLTPSQRIEILLEEWDDLCFLHLRNSFETFSVTVNEIYLRRNDNDFNCTLTVMKNGITWYLGKGVGQNKQEARCNAAKRAVKACLENSPPVQIYEGKTKRRTRTRKLRYLPDYMKQVRLNLQTIASHVLKEIQTNCISPDVLKIENSHDCKNSKEENINGVKTPPEDERENDSTNSNKILKELSHSEVKETRHSQPDSKITSQLVEIKLVHPDSKKTYRQRTERLCKDFSELVSKVFVFHENYHRWRSCNYLLKESFAHSKVAFEFNIKKHNGIECTVKIRLKDDEKLILGIGCGKSRLNAETYVSKRVLDELLKKCYTIVVKKEVVSEGVVPLTWLLDPRNKHSSQIFATTKENEINSVRSCATVGTLKGGNGDATPYFQKKVEELLDQIVRRIHGEEIVPDLVFSTELSDRQMKCIEQIVMEKREYHILKSKIVEFDTKRHLVVSETKNSASLFKRIGLQGGKTEKYEIFNPGSLTVALISTGKIFQ